MMMRPLYSVPDYYTPLIYLCIAICGWTLILTVLHKRMDVHSIIGTSTSNLHTLSYMGMSLFLIIITHRIVVNLLLQYYMTSTQCSLLCYSLTTLLMVGLFPKDTIRFIRCIGRSIISHHVYFSDVIMVDVLISFSHVLTSIFTGLMDMTPYAYHPFIPCITSLPFIIRLRQCCIEYTNTSSNRHVLNALKYATAIPVLFLSHYTQQGDPLWRRIGPYEFNMLQLWYLSVMITNMMAFTWDITMDWGIIQLNSNQTIVIRKTSQFGSILAIALNAVLRLLKIYGHMSYLPSAYLNMAEITRRGIWVLLRFEYEWIKKTQRIDIPTVFMDHKL
ncbi:EXS family-domain-containing protein [Pilobolus umbonatus]|nr:EXS family-domain-containing protein [Pilobolus umbonatus]